VIADRGYDSDPLRQRLQKRGIELIAPYRKNNQHRRYEDGRKLRRYKPR
jgi:IS5 family transposase